MPSPFDQFSVGLRHPHQLTQRAGIKAVAGGDPNLRIEPEFGLTAAGAHVYVRRLARIALVGVEEKAETLVAENHRHGAILGKAQATELRVILELAPAYPSDARLRCPFACCLVRLLRSSVVNGSNGPEW
jgi:hypothetical protein